MPTLPPTVESYVLPDPPVYLSWQNICAQPVPGTTVLLPTFTFVSTKPRPGRPHVNTKPKCLCHKPSLCNSWLWEKPNGNGMVLVGKGAWNPCQVTDGTTALQPGLHLEFDPKPEPEGVAKIYISHSGTGQQSMYVRYDLVQIWEDGVDGGIETRFGILPKPCLFTTLIMLQPGLHFVSVGFSDAFLNANPSEVTYRFTVDANYQVSTVTQFP